jgi:hypothetical protein
MTDTPDTQKTLRDLALAAVPAEQHAEMLTRASDLGIVQNNDIGWALVGTERASIAAARAATEAATKTSAAAAGIPDQIYKSVAAGGQDLRAIMGQEVRSAGTEVGQAVTAAIQSAAASGADALRQAAADLPDVARGQQDAIVSEWRAALADAARTEARRALASRMTRSWGMVVLSLAFAAAVGAAGMWGAARMTGHLTPWSYPLMLTPAGTPQCGFLRALPGQRVCLVQPTP